MNSARIVFIGLIAWFFARNVMVPPSFDDYSYAFVWREASLDTGYLADNYIDLEHRIGSIGDIIDAQRMHYDVWGGRTVAHCFVQLFMWLGKDVFNVANAAVFGLLMVLIVKLADVRFSTANLLWIFFGLWVAIPDWVLSTLWLTGACNYLWTTALQLTFIYFFTCPPTLCALQAPRLLLSRPPAPKRLRLLKPKIAVVLAITLGLLAGWTNEASGAVTILLSLYFVTRSKQWRTWHGASVIALIIGYFLLMSAPGNIERLRFALPDFHLTALIIIDHICGGFAEVLSGETMLFVPIAICAIKFGRSIGEKIIVWTAAAILVPTAMVFSPVFASYTCLASTAFLSVASTAAFARLLQTWSAMKSRVFRRLATALIAIGVISLILSVVADFTLYHQWREQLVLMEAQRDDDCVQLPAMNYCDGLIKILGARVMNVYLERRHSAGVAEDPNDFYTRAFASYHGLKGARLIDEH